MALRFACTVLAIAVTVHAGWTLYGNTLDHHEETPCGLLALCWMLLLLLMPNGRSMVKL
jgi:hypothetical protein